LNMLGRPRWRGAAVILLDTTTATHPHDFLTLKHIPVVRL